MKWTTFEDALPRYQIIYVTDWCSVWTACSCCFNPPNWNSFAKSNPRYGWCPIPTPEVPERPSGLHVCGSSRSNKGICTETVDRKLLYIWKGQTEIVNFCPFCGYEAIRKEKI